MIAENTGLGFIAPDTFAADIAIEIRNTGQARYALDLLEADILVVLVLGEDGRDTVEGSHRGRVGENKEHLRS